MATVVHFKNDLRQLAVAVLYLNLDRAGVDFPTTTRAHPSYLVHVTRVPGKDVLEGSHRKLFPFLVSGDFWQRVVVPLFADASTLVKVHEEHNETLRQQINREYLLTGDHQTLIAKIEQALIDGAVAQGFLPEGTTEEGFIAEPEAPGEPVVPPGTNDGSPYARFD